MKKLCTCVALAVALVALSAITALAATTVSGPGTVERGETVSISISTDAEGFAGAIVTSGLEVVSSPDNGFASSGSVIMIRGITPMSATYVCRVTGDPGTQVSFGISGGTEVTNEDGDEASVSVSPWSATVQEPPPTDPPTDPPTAPPSEPPTSPPETVTPDPDVPALSPGPTNNGAPPDSGGITAPPGPEMPPLDTGGGGTNTGRPGGGAAAQTTASAAPTPRPDGYPKTADASLDLWMMFGVACVCAAVAVLAARKAFNR